MNTAQTIAETILGAVNWRDDVTGYLQCPGEAKHTHNTGKRHCRVKLDGAPTVYCVHRSCIADVEAANERLRAALRDDADNGTKPEKRRTTAKERTAIRRRLREQIVKTQAVASLVSILRDYDFEPAEMFEDSPVRLLDDPANDWRLHLHLFAPDDVVWLGWTTATCGDSADDATKAKAREHFRPVKEWLALGHAPGQFTCPSTFKPETHSRCNEAVLQKKFLVIESDILNKSQMGSVIAWCRQFMRLRAIVDTGGKSLHGWFDQPEPEIESELKLILPNLGRRGEQETLDSALFKPSQPCRLPGKTRGGKIQSLLYLDLEAAR